MHEYLKAIGIKNNSFMLTLLDPDLAGVNPYDPGLNWLYKKKILKECINNYWYFLREVVRLPTQGGQPMRYILHRGNLAFNYLSMLNNCIFYELPRQTGKTISVLIRYLYIYNFGTTNSKCAFLHKGLEGSKDNLQTLKDLRDMLPEYLQLKVKYNGEKADYGKNNATEIVNPLNNNSIKCFAGATSKLKAASILRGKTLPLIYFDEYAFLEHNETVYLNGAPAYRTASENAKRVGAPYGITITTTAGFMNSDAGREAYSMKEAATPFNESWYDFTYPQLKQLLDSNTKSNFVYIKFGYQELGYSEQWFNEICRLLKNSWPDIRREVLLDWNMGIENSPFDPDDLDIIRGLVRKPISVVYLLGKYRFETYLQANVAQYPPIIGVDVAAGYKQDSSTITVIDSQTTKVLGCMNCNYISTVDLARCIEFIVKNWMPNSVVCCERNGVGHGVIANLKKAGLTKNLYYEIKDVVVEERQDGVHSYKQKIRTKVYGLNSTKSARKELIDILTDRVEMHKDKIISPIIYNELLGMEIKRNGKVEHSESTHDDQIFSMLMALYVWYNGTNLEERYGIKKTSIKTDEDIDEEVDYFDPDTVDITGSFNTSDEISEAIAPTIQQLKEDSNQVDLREFLNKRHVLEQQQFLDLASTPLGEKAIRTTFNIPKDTPLNSFLGIPDTGSSNIPNKVFDDFYKQSMYGEGQLSFNGAIPAQEALYMENDDYSYSKNFNMSMIPSNY